MASRSCIRRPPFRGLTRRLGWFQTGPGAAPRLTSQEHQRSAYSGTESSPLRGPGDEDPVHGEAGDQEH